jgi:ABC-type amino acid transport substrate-binding protein
MTACRAALALSLALRALPALAGWSGPAEPVRFAPEQDYGPFVFQRVDGRIDGLSVELLTVLEQQLGLQIQMLPARPLKQQLEALRERRADLVSSLRPTPERGEYALFTAPYAAVPTIVVARPGQAGVGLAQLAGRPVAVGQGYAVEPVVRARHPRVAWQAVSDDGVALAGVRDGRFDAAVLDAASFAYLAGERRLTGLLPVQTIDFEYQLSFAVRKDWPELRDALDAAIRAVPADRRQAIVRRWLEPAARPGRTPWSTRIGWALVGAAAAGALVLGLRGLWRRQAGRGA